MILPSSPSLFRSFFLGGFECSSHRRFDGQRLDLLAATGHERLVAEDYRLLSHHGITSARDGLRWHLIETVPGHYNWSSVLPMLRAARANGTQITWDLCHYGWPDDLDIWSPNFVDRFARFATGAAQLVRDETEGDAFYCPINEISYWAWAGGEVGRFNPCCHQRGPDLKRQLVRATIAAIDGIRAVDRRARFITAEPLINVEGGLGDEHHIRGAETYRLSQFEVLEMLAGRLEPELGGAAEFIDIVGVNYYPDNQWYHAGPTIPLGHHAYRPLHDMLIEVHRRYGRPILMAETGAEGSGRPSWLHYVCAEVREAMEAGVPMEGVCLYPIIDYPGWDNERICHVGLLSAVDDHGRRSVCAPLARELSRQQELFRELDTVANTQAGTLAAAE
ncbi:beta-glucosidase [Microvirga aerophila]|uniref:Beta-glucosidase n=1 Tax=Microvirga aerophila TaxID=670291 RepID=A0A512BTF6_9HYPH|nr:beta-glucosidase [Microvirga aerophila]GEO15214.1 beta-glucosidase [Microvirga aerophila]